jgi:dihydrofolate synthase/folylpolyglutamate synthase
MSLADHFGHAALIKSFPAGGQRSFTAADREIGRLMALHPKGFDLSLDRIIRLLAKLGNPQEKLPPVIHIAGTNGKGSTAAFSRALLEASGLKVHVHTSPHLVNWHERFRIGAAGGGKLVADDVLAEAVARVAKVNDGEYVTVFEILTAVTFLLFSEHPADAAIIEVGLGGRFDATNVIDRPAVSVIMPISLDHEVYLGDRVELIAVEKAGIIKPGVPLVIGAQESPSAQDVLIATAERLDCARLVYGHDFMAYEQDGRMVYRDEIGPMVLTPPKLPGRHQFANAAAAIAAVKVAGFELDQHAADRAMTTVYWPGRMQWLPRGKLSDLAPQGAEIWLDGVTIRVPASSLPKRLQNRESGLHGRCF